MNATNIFVAVFLCFFLYSDAFIPFKRNVGTKDMMYEFNPYYPAFQPIQQSPIYGIECMDNACYNQRFLTLRYQNLVIVKYINHWTPLTSGNSGRWSVTCPSNMLSLGLWCHENSCNKIRLVCGTIGVGFSMTKSRTIINPPNSPSSVNCPDGKYVQGIECFGYDCQRRGLRCVGLEYNRRVQGSFPLGTIENRQTYTHWHSNEWSGQSNIVDGPFFAMHCDGPHYCDNKLYYYVERGTTPLLGKIQAWRGPVNKFGQKASCPKGMVVRQFKCVFDFCKDLYIGCARPASSKIKVVDADQMPSDALSYYWPFKDTASCPEGYFIREISCLSEFCAHIVLGCVKITFIE